MKLWRIWQCPCIPYSGENPIILATKIALSLNCNLFGVDWYELYMRCSKMAGNLFIDFSTSTKIEWKCYVHDTTGYNRVILRANPYNDGPLAYFIIL